MRKKIKAQATLKSYADKTALFYEIYVELPDSYVPALEFFTFMREEGYSHQAIRQARSGLTHEYDKEWRNTGRWRGGCLWHPIIIEFFASLPTLPAWQACPLDHAEVCAMANRCGEMFDGLHDKAMLLLAHAMGSRRSEVVALNGNDLDFSDPRALTITIRKSKGDQEAKGHEVRIDRIGGFYCPVAALERWIKAADITDGPLFYWIDKGGGLVQRLNAKSLNDLVKRLVKLIGYDPDKYSSMSLRRGRVHQDAADGKTPGEIMRKTLHQGPASLVPYAPSPYSGVYRIAAKARRAIKCLAPKRSSSQGTFEF